MQTQVTWKLTPEEASTIRVALEAQLSNEQHFANDRSTDWKLRRLSQARANKLEKILEDA